MTDYILSLDWDFYFAHILIAALAYKNRHNLEAAAKGGNGVYQWAEVLQAVCLLLMVLYTLKIIYHGAEPNGIVYGSLLAGSGIGVTGSLLQDKIKSNK